MKTKDVEQKTGVSKQTVLYYEKEGLLQPDRDENGYRNYDEKDIQTILVIKLLRSMSISIDDIKLVLQDQLSFEECLQIQTSFVEESRIALDQTQETIRLYKDKKLPMIPALQQIEKTDKSLFGYKKTSNTVSIGRKLTKSFLVRKIMIQIMISILLGIICYYGMNLNSVFAAVGCSASMMILFTLSYVLGFGEIGLFSTQNNAGQFIEFTSTGIAFIEQTIAGRIKYILGLLQGTDPLKYVDYSDIESVEYRYVVRYMKIPGSNVSKDCSTTDYYFTMKDGSTYQLINPILLEQDKKYIDCIIKSKHLLK